MRCNIPWHGLYRVLLYGGITYSIFELCNKGFCAWTWMNRMAWRGHHIYIYNNALVYMGGKICVALAAKAKKESGRAF